MMGMGYGDEGYGSGPYGSLPPSFGLASAVALNGTHVQLTFNSLVDFTYPAILNPANYSISPTLTIITVEEGDAAGVVLTTSPQDNVLYTVTVAAARSTFGTLLNPSLNTATFAGFSRVPGYFAVATSATRVRVVFGQVMLNDSNLSSSSSYTIEDLNGNPLSVVSATPEQATNPQSVVLTLGSNLGESDFYVCTVSSAVHTTTGLGVLPPTSVFQWLQGNNQFQVPLNVFTGEVSGGLFGTPDGLVFFSPSLNVAAPNSIIQVEEVDVCTTAYDTYVVPAPIDPTVLFTYGGGIVPTPSPDPYLLNQCVLWAPFPRNFEAQIILGFTGAANQDGYDGAVDTSCSILMQQQWALGYVALLNDPAWYLLPKLSPLQSVPPMFITAKNLSPIPPGPYSILVLHVAMGGNSTFTVGTPKKIAHASASIQGTSRFIGAAGPPAVVLADASLSAGATVTALGRHVAGGAIDILGQAFVRALGEIPPPPFFPTDLLGFSIFRASAHLIRGAHATTLGVSTVVAKGHVRRGVAANVSALASLAATATVRWSAHAHLTGSAAVTATATVTHKAETFPVGNSSVTATAS
jgi:hypothetical protein